jgi:hypothetical protein
MIQQQAPPTIAPGNPIGYAPIYGPPPLAADALPGSPAPADVQGKRWVDGLLIGLGAGAAVACLFTWGLVDQLYSGADIRAMERAATVANATAEAAEQNAANAEANAQQWEQFSAAQGQTIDGVRALVCE